MKTNETSQFRFTLQVLGLLTLAAVLGCHFKTEEDWDKERFELQLAAIKSEKSDTLYFYDVQGADSLLQSITGMPGVKRVVVECCNDITDAGIQEIATLPDLTSVTFYELTIPNGWIELLQSSPHLEELDLTPYEPLDFSIAAVLALPHLNKLHLDVYVDPKDSNAAAAERWVDATLEGMREARSLEELRLTGNVFVERKKLLVRLQTELPNCKIKLAKSQGKGNPPLIPLTDDE